MEHIRTRIPLTVLLLSIVATWSSLTHAATTASTRNEPILAVIDFYPFGYSSDDGRARGMVFDIEKILEKYSGIDIDARLMSTPRALRSASVGQNDLLFSYKDDDMVPNVTWLGNLGCLTPLVVPRIGSGINSLSDLNNKKVGFVGLGYFDIGPKDRWNLEPVVLTNNFLMMKMLIRGRIDAIVVNNAVLNAFMANPNIIEGLPTNWQTTLGYPLPLRQFETHISISNDSPFFHMAPTFRDAIIRARDKKEFEFIFKKYGSPLGGRCFNSTEIKEHLWINKNQ